MTLEEVRELVEGLCELAEARKSLEANIVLLAEGQDKLAARIAGLEARPGSGTEAGLEERLAKMEAELDEKLTEKEVRDIVESEIEDTTVEVEAYLRT